MMRTENEFDSFEGATSSINNDIAMTSTLTWLKRQTHLIYSLRTRRQSTAKHQWKGWRRLIDDSSHFTQRSEFIISLFQFSWWLSHLLSLSTVNRVTLHSNVSCFLFVFCMPRWDQSQTLERDQVDTCFHFIAGDNKNGHNDDIQSRGRHSLLKWSKRSKDRRAKNEISKTRIK